MPLNPMKLTASDLKAEIAANVHQVLCASGVIAWAAQPEDIAELAVRITERIQKHFVVLYPSEH